MSGVEPKSLQSRDYSPFTPGQPLPPNMFEGRTHEVETLLESCKHTIHTKRIARSYIQGERGIGKSSLASFVCEIADRQLKMLTLQVHLGGAGNLDQMAERIFQDLAQTSQNRSWHDKLTKAFGSHIKSVGLFGTRIEFAATSEDLKHLWQHLANELRDLLKLLDGQRDGVLLILDDINGLANTPAFANWLKSFVDGVATSDEPLSLHLILVSLPERRQKIIEHNPSLNRIFSILDMKPLSAEDTRKYVIQTLESVRMSIDEEALQIIVRFSGGYPAILQEIADAAFKRCQTDRIGLDDVVDGVIDAAETIGRKYIQPEVLDAIRSNKYRSILGRIASLTTKDSFSRKSVLDKLDSAEQKVFDNFVRRMKELDVLVQNERGTYRFKNELNRLYYRIAAQAQSSAERKEE